ncbi:MAG: hypothetical protein KC492_33490 [Myxococcales bacterium]|nr:hypothetical protein [Myxococcales bacterium]
MRHCRSPDARIANPALPKEIFSWLLEETRDDKGNVIKYFYKAEDRVGVPSALWEAHRRDGFASAVHK